MKKNNKLWLIIPLILIFIVLYRTELLIGIVSLFIDEGGRDTKPLYVLMKNNNVDGYRKFLEKPDTKINVYDLSSIASLDNSIFFDILVDEYKFDVNMKNLELNTSALLLVADGFNYIGLKRLINAGANVNFTNKSGKTPLINSINAHAGGNQEKQKEKYRIVELLISSGAVLNPESISYLTPTPLGEALYQKRADIVKLLIRSGADVFHKDGDGYNYYFYAYTPELAEILVNNGLDINDTKNKMNKSPLQAFVTNNNYSFDSIKQFISLGADLCHKDIKGNTILNYAERRGINLYDTEKTEFNQPKIIFNRNSELYKYLDNKYKDYCL